MKRLFALALIPATVMAADCYMADRTVTRSTVTIAERSAIKPEVVPSPDGGRRCMVTFKVRIGADWFTTHGEYDWPGDRPREEACAVAVKRAEDSVLERVASSRIVSEKVLVCRENPDLNKIGRAHV